MASKLIGAWGHRAHGRVRPARARQTGLAARLPLEHATAVIDGICAHDDFVSIRLYGHPWVSGEYWPMITPCFEVHAHDENGTRYDGIPDEWSGSANGEGSGGFWFWPPVTRSAKRVRVTVSTLWEAAWADIEIPGR